MGGNPFLLFFPVIIVCGMVFDRGNGIFATLLSAVLAIYYLIPPYQALALNSDDVVAVSLFIFIGLVMSVLVEALHLAYVNLEKSHAQIASSAHEQQVLMDELTHRMRNHLATIAALLRLQSRSVDEPAARASLSTAADRVQIIAQVHDRLDIQGDRAVVDSRGYITDLCDDLKAGLIGLRPVALEIAIESHPIGIQKAVAIGLIINELTTNALKYAFPDEERGRIKISFERSGKEYHLIVRDNGTGMDGQQRGTGMGLKLVRTLAAQLGGDLEISDAQPGTRFVITFPVAHASSADEARSPKNYKQ
jgi:two-component sensor histidine kinase